MNITLEVQHRRHLKFLRNWVVIERWNFDALKHDRGEIPPANTSRIRSIHRTKKQAIRHASARARNLNSERGVQVELKIRNMDGRYAEGETYGHDDPGVKG